MRFIFEELSVSTKRPFTVKATLSEEEKKTLVAFSKKAQMSEAELIRYFLRPEDAVTRGVDLTEDEERTEMIRIRVSPSEKKSIENRASELGVSMSAFMRRTALVGRVEKIDVDRASIDKIYHELLKEGTNLNQLMYFLNAQGLPAYNEKAVFRTLEKVYQVGRKLDRFIDELEKRYFVGGDVK